MGKKSTKKILELKNCNVTFNTDLAEVCAVKNVNFEVFDKEFLTIVGPSGCGKSTIFSVISGLIKVTSGKIIKKDELKIGLMLQQDHLFPWRTVFQNSILGLEIIKKTDKKSIEYVKGLLKLCGLSEFQEHFPNEISGGMRQKVALVRTLATNPDLLLLDEPFSALDFQTRIKISDEIRSIIKSKGKTAILVTHDIGEAVTVSDRVIVLSRRPARVKKTFKINFSASKASKNAEFSSIEKRNQPEFSSYFNEIWKEIEDYDS